ncbi:alpha/beta hydrolase [Methylocella tundrae]|uniref:alpha/beta fold hydrolase n=1 Tax=Methylocella tundrae TaxID=227605 RepID=UPI0030FE60B8|nr:alpha/beta hydrolase [Methylocella tundrae]
MPLAEPLAEPSFESCFISASDGLRLHFRDYGSPLDPGLPVVCLPGLTRSAADFGPLASALAGGLAGNRRRRVLALDYRGRGLSGYDRDWKNYSLPVENDDILSVLTAAGVERAVLVGTSRGGLHVMLLSATRPSIIAGAVLNDIGPVLEPQGLARIRSYVGKLPPPKSEADAVDLLKRLMSEHFKGLREADWALYAKLTFADETGRFGGRYDQKLMKTIESIDLEQPAPALWAQFDGLRAVPLLAIRGGNSDLLSPATLAEMARRHPNCETYIVEGQGHPPLLIDAPSIQRIAAFVAQTEG